MQDYRVSGKADYFFFELSFLKVPLGNPDKCLPMFGKCLSSSHIKLCLVKKSLEWFIADVSGIVHTLVDVFAGVDAGTQVFLSVILSKTKLSLYIFMARHISSHIHIDTATMRSVLEESYFSIKPP